ncbi:uncharacterized protein LOC142523126 [Primulina tabacum]|uniref:uncharacterized protein LOC142523126 n=1 Tax=Primulina tabacum TaxID=48773 RepID=UPI003F59BEC2
MPADEMHAVIKLWPFQGWAMDLIGKIYLPSSKRHSFIIVATYFFTKWVEALHMKKIEQKDVIVFVKEHIIHRFGIPQSITTDQGTMFMGSDMKEFAEEYGIQLINSSPHYPQSNCQAEPSNQRSATGLSPFTLTYGHDAVLPMEVVVPSLRVMKQNELEPELYTEAMIMELEDLDELKMQTYNALILQKSKAARSYNKRVNKKIFEERDVVWKVILPLGSKDREFDKWPPNWEGAFKVHQVLDGNAYWLASLDGEPHMRCIKGKYLKYYYPNSWVGISDIYGSCSWV